MAWLLAELGKNPVPPDVVALLRAHGSTLLHATLTDRIATIAVAEVKRFSRRLHDVAPELLQHVLLADNCLVLRQASQSDPQLMQLVAASSNATLVVALRRHGSIFAEALRMYEEGSRRPLQQLMSRLPVSGIWKLQHEFLLRVIRACRLHPGLNNMFYV